MGSGVSRGRPLRLVETQPPTIAELPRWLFAEQRAVWLIVSFLLAADVCLIGIHVWAEAQSHPNQLFRIDVDRGYAEAFQGVKYIYLLTSTTVLTLTYRSWQVALWLPMFAYLLVDDLMMVHEIGGAKLVRLLGLHSAFGLRAQDFGEVLVTAGAAATLGLPLLLGYLLGHRTSRWFYHMMALLTIALAGFGVVIDLVHVRFSSIARHFDWIAVLEDGGEMIVITCMAVFLTRVAVTGGRPGLQERSAG